MVGASLLQSDDDSDVPDLDLGPGSRRRKFFNRPITDDYDEIRNRRKTYKNIMSISFILIFLALIYFVYSAISKINKIDQELADFRLSSQQVENISDEMKKLKMQLNVIQENNNLSSNTTLRPTTDLIYDRLADISSRLDNLKDAFQKTSLSMEDVTSRMSRVENKCLAVCQHDTVGGLPVPRGREQPRRRQTANEKKGKPQAGEEIVFRRNDD